MDRVSEPGPFYYHQNALWSASALSDTTGTGVEGYSYGAYGYQTVILPGADGMLWTADDNILPGAKSSYGNPFLFTEQRYDPEAGLLYYKNRYDSTFFGRFMSRDTLGYTGYQDAYQAGTNLYQYVSSNPVKYTDPDGLTLTRGGPMPGGSCTSRDIGVHHSYTKRWPCKRVCSWGWQETNFGVAEITATLCCNYNGVNDQPPGTWQLVNPPDWEFTKECNAPACPGKDVAAQLEGDPNKP